MTTFGTFDFGLTGDQEQRASRLHAESIVIDMLYWGPVTHRSFPDALSDELKSRYESHRSDARVGADTLTLISEHCDEGGALGYRQAWEDSGVDAGSRSTVFTSMHALASSFGFHQRQFDRFDWLDKALTASDVRDAKAAGRRSGWLNSQIIGAMDVALLDSVYDLGVRMIQPTYNNMNHFGAGCTERTDAGVSNTGAKIVARMNELGVILDTSHCGRQTTLDCCAISDAPVIVSHSCAQAVYPHDRGKSDAELDAIAATGGLVGVVTVPFFLGKGPDVGMQAFMDHLDHIVGRIGAEHVGIGTDWPMYYPKWAASKVFSRGQLAASGFYDEHDVQPEVNLVGFDDYRDFPNITRGLVSRGYTDEQIRAILGENFLRVFEKVCG